MAKPRGSAGQFVLIVAENAEARARLLSFVPPTFACEAVERAPQAVEWLEHTSAIRHRPAPIVIVHAATAIAASVILAPFAQAPLPFLLLACVDAGGVPLGAVVPDEVVRGPVSSDEVGIRLRGLARLAGRELQLQRLRRYVPATLFQSLQESGAPQPPTRKLFSILFADIRGFTDASGFCTPEEIVGLLNDYLSVAARLIHARGGTLDKFTGDGICAYFDAERDNQHAVHAVEAALDLQSRLDGFKSTWFERGILPLAAGIGVTTGYATLGSIGSSERADYTVIGSVVNLSARLQAFAKGGQVVIDHETFERVHLGFEIETPIAAQIKGFEQLVKVYPVHNRAAHKEGRTFLDEL